MKVSNGSFGKRFHQRITCFLVAFFIMAALLANASTAHAYTTWVGGDWGGRDFVLGDGDILAGTFTNIGRLVIGTGITVYGRANFVAIGAHEILINGNLFGDPDCPPSIDLIAENSLTLGGSLDQWYSAKLVGETISLLEGSSINSFMTLRQPSSPPIGSPGYFSAGGTISMGRVSGIGSGIRGITHEGGSGGYYKFYRPPQLVIPPMLIALPDSPVVMESDPFAMQPVPVPSSLILLALGLGLVAMVRWSGGH